MKKSILITITLLLIAAIAVGVVVYAVGGNKNEDEPSAAVVDKEAENENVGPDAANEPEPVPAEPAVVSLEEYWAKLKAERSGEPFTLEEIYLRCSELFVAPKVLHYRENFFVRFFGSMVMGERYTETGFAASDTEDLVLEIAPERATENEIYLIFVASVTNCFGDCVIYEDYDYAAHNYNRNMRVQFAYCDGYKEFGFDNAQNYYDAYKSGSCSKFLSRDVISMVKHKIFFVNSYGDLGENRYENFKSEAIANGVNIK